MRALIITIFTSIWIYIILTTNPLAGFLCIITSLFLYQTIIKSRFKLFTILSLALLLLIQFKTTQVKDLSYLDNDEQRVQSENLKLYPPVFIRIGPKHLWIPLAHWLEGRDESIIYRRIENNLGEVLSLNQYFFANHPRSRLGISEIQKFPYLFLPLFAIGASSLFKNKRSPAILSLAIISPLVILSIIGSKNNLGPFSLLPVFVLSISHGGSMVFPKLSKKQKWIALILFLLTFIQQISYAFN